HVSLVVLVVVEAHGLLVDVGLECAVVVREIGDLVCHGHPPRVGCLETSTSWSRVASPAMTVALWAGRRLHFVGIGGAGMSGLALVARALGAEVSGSDRAESSYMDPLRAEGIEPAIGHDAANVPDGAEVVVSTAIARDN